MLRVRFKNPNFLYTGYGIAVLYIYFNRYIEEEVILFVNTKEKRWKNEKKKNLENDEVLESIQSVWA